MASFIIEGGRRLTGEIVPQGAKNEALPGDLCDIAYFRTGTYQKHTRHLGCEQPNPIVGRCRCESHAECSGRLYFPGRRGEHGICAER